MTDSRQDFAPDQDVTRARICSVIRAIPRGEIRAYADVALASGLPGRARLVARVLAHSTLADDLPWHRVLRADGRIAFPVGSEPYERQRELLRAEGVMIVNGRAVQQRNRDLDSLLWQP